jgi:hypothetical protein
MRYDEHAPSWAQTIDGPTDALASEIQETHRRREMEPCPAHTEGTRYWPGALSGNSASGFSKAASYHLRAGPCWKLRRRVEQEALDEIQESPMEGGGFSFHPVFGPDQLGLCGVEEWPRCPFSSET